MEIKEVIDRLNGDIKADVSMKEKLKRYTDVYYGISLHTSGACPKYNPLGNRQTSITPPNYFGEQYQEIFTSRLLSRHPREQEETFQWRLSQYKPMTKSAFLQVIGLVSSTIFQDSNYSIEIPNDADSGYIWGNNFSGYDLPGWFVNVGIKSICEDPNGLIVRIPNNPYFEQSNEKLDVDIWFVNSKDIIYLSKDEVIFKKDNYAYFIDDIAIWRFSLNDTKYSLSGEDSEGYYSHLMDRLPVTVAGGDWNSHGFFDSYLDNAKAAADEFISSYSAEQMVDKEASHPFIIMGQSDCSFCDGTGKETVDCDTCADGIEQISCHVCKGAGIMSNNPGERKLVPIEDMKNDHVKIVTPDTTINSYHHNKNKDIFEMILDSLHLWKTTEAQSGNAKAIDQERLYLFISKIANHLFDKVIYDTIKDIIAYRNVTSNQGDINPSAYDFQIIKPTQYQIKNAADLLNEYAEGSKSGLPVFVRAKMSQDFIDKQYSGDRLMKRKAEILSEADLTYCYTEQEKQSLLLTGAIERRDLQKSVQLPKILDSIVREKSEQWFIEASFDKILKEIDDRFQPENKLQMPTNNLGDDGLPIEIAAEP